MEDFRPSGAPSAVGDEPLAPAWAACQAAWADPGGHERVAELALVHGEYPWLARQYRAVLAQRPDDAIARDRLARIGRMAEAAMRATALPPAPEARRPNRMKLLLIALVVVLGGGLYAAHVISTSQAVRGEGTRVPARGKAPAESPVSRPAG